MARILIVDDSPSQLEGLKRLVEKLGHQTLTAVDLYKLLVIRRRWSLRHYEQWISHMITAALL